MFSRLIIAALLSVIAAGCANPTDARHSLAEWEHDLLDAECAQLARVPSQNIHLAVAGTLPRAECIDALRAQGVGGDVRRAMAHPELFSIDPVAADACLEAIAAHRQERGDAGARDACRDVVVWSPDALGDEVGDPCRADIGCARGLECRDVDASGCGACAARPVVRGGEGASCAVDECADWLVCGGARPHCRRMREEGAIVGERERCGLVLHDRWLVSTECREGLACLPSALGGSTCVRPLAVGEPCSLDDACVPGAICIDGQCAPPSYVPEHEPCDTSRGLVCALDQECTCGSVTAPGSDCVSTCERLAALGEACSDERSGGDRHCAAGLRCVDAVCVALDVETTPAIERVPSDAP